MILYLARYLYLQTKLNQSNKKMKNIQLTLLALLVVTVTSAQNFNGFALYNSQGSSTTYLIDENQNIAHTWNMTTECNYTVQLKENGNLVRGTKGNTSVLALEI